MCVDLRCTDEYIFLQVDIIESLIRDYSMDTERLLDIINKSDLLDYINKSYDAYNSCGMDGVMIDVIRYLDGEGYVNAKELVKKQDTYELVTLENGVNDRVIRNIVERTIACMVSELMKRYNVDYKEAYNILYRIKFVGLLRNRDTLMWSESNYYLFNMLEKELNGEEY